MEVKRGTPVTQQRSVLHRRRRRSRASARPWVELLEVRALPAAPAWTAGLSFVAEQESHTSQSNPQPGGNDHLVNAQGLTWQPPTAQTPGPWALVNGYLGDGVSGSADVDFYSFTLTNAATVTLTTFDTPGSSATTVLSLYNSDADALGFDLNGNHNDPNDPTGHRLLAQAVGSAADGGASITYNLAGGFTYYVAVSGGGNQYFHPFIPQSGLAGSTGAYGLAITETDLPSTVGPTVIASNPAQNAILTSSPLVIRVDFNSAIDPSLLSSQNVQLIDLSLPSNDPNYSPALAMHFSPNANELQLMPAAPLQNGFYQLILKGTGSSALMDPTDTYALGQVSSNSSGADFTLNFLVDATATPTDTAATAVDLGDVTDGRLVQQAGVIGTDPFYSNFTDPTNYTSFSNNYAGAQVNMYHFHVSGSGNYVLLAEVFAGRIGSPLDSGLSLFREDTPGHLVEVPIAANDNTGNSLSATDGANYFGNPLQSDSALTAGLTSGDYVLAVSSGPNTPDPLLLRSPGEVIPDPTGQNNPGLVFDPNISHSGSGGSWNFMGLSTGPYVLNFQVRPNPGAPHVVAVSPASNSTQDGSALVTLTVQFDQAVNVQQLAYQAYLQTQQQGMSAIFVRGADGQDYYPRLVSYDTTTYTATLQMLDSLPNGLNTLHISGPLGLTNLGGTPLAGNDPSGDYVVPFTIINSSVGGSGGGLAFTDLEPNNSLGTAQNLGTLFPANQLQAGVTITRDFSNNPGAISDTGDFYRFTVTQARQYTFTLIGSGLPSGITPVVTDLSGAVQSGTPSFVGGGAVVTATLSPGTYVVSVSGWTTAQAPGVKYQLRISFGQAPDNPPPLTVGAAPLLSIRLVNSGPPAPSIMPPLPGGLGNNSGPDLAAVGSMLARGAIGGITGSNGEPGASAPGVTVAAQTSAYSLVQELVQLAILAQLDGGGANLEIESGSGAPWTDTYFGPMPGRNTLDSLFSAADGAAEPTGPTLWFAPQPAEEFQDFEKQDGGQDDTAVVDNSFADPAFFDEGACVSAAATVAVMQGGLKKRKRPAGQVPRSWSAK
jgi:hypothetical protein